MSPGRASEIRHPEPPPGSPSQSTEIHAAGATRTIRQRPTKLRRSSADNGSKASLAETYGATCQHDDGDVSQADQNTREELAFENLPEDILNSIHSLLPLRDAARAACVSPVFLRSWRCYSNLVLNNHTLGLIGKKFEEIEISLVRRVDQIIENHYANGVKLKTLDLTLYPYEDTNASYLYRWLQITVKPGIMELRLKLYTLTGKKYYSFPCSVLSDIAAASSIQSLHLTFCDFHPTSTLGCLKRLKSLDLFMVNITEEGLGHLLSKSFALEQLVMFACSGIVCLRIPFTLQKLKLLCVTRCQMMQVIQIDAPNLCSFQYKGSPLVEFSVRNSSQLKEVNFSTPDSSTPGILSEARARLPSITPNVESLTLRSHKENVDTPMLSSKLINLKNLEIRVRPSEEAFSPTYDIFSIVSFLDASPVLESFILRVWKDPIMLDPVVGDDEKYARRKTECRHNNLRLVNIVGFCSAKSMVELTIHILESAPSLERLTLDTARGCDTRSRCRASTKIGQCSWMSKTALTEAHKDMEVAGRYIAGRVPMGVEFQVLEPCSRCHGGKP